MSPYFVPMIIVNMVPGLVSVRFGLKGPNMSHVVGLLDGGALIGEASGPSSAATWTPCSAGGCEASVTPLGWAGSTPCARCRRATTTRQQASRPFDNDRDGFVIGEGAGMVVIEELEHARRAAPDLCRDHRLRLTSDAYHMTAAGAQTARARSAACARRSRMPASIRRLGYINAHGTSTPQNDTAETLAIKRSSASTPSGSDLLDQVDDRPPAGRGGGRRGSSSPC